MIHHRFSPEELVAAYLADPLRVPQQALPWSTCDVQTVLEILQRNKVPLLSLTESEESRGLLNNPLFQAARYAEEQEFAGLRAEYALVKETLASAGTPDVLIKSVGLAPSFPYKSDNLDVLYKPQDVERVRTVLRDLGYVELKNVEEPHKYLFRKFRAGRSISAIHVHGHVGWMVSFLDEEALWRRCQASADDALVTLPAAEDALLTTLAHYFYEDKRVALLDVLNVAHCLRRGVDWDEVYRIATWRGWRDGLNVSLLLCAYQEQALYGETPIPPAIREQAWHALSGWTRLLLERWLGASEVAPPALGQDGKRSLSGRGIKQLPLRIPFVLSKIFFYAKLVRDPTRSATRKVKDLAVHTANGTKLRLHIHSQPAMLVTFSGVDGCGKTTQAEPLRSAFHTCQLRARYEWSRGGSSRWVGLFTSLSKQRTQADTRLAGAIESHRVDKVQARQQRFRSPWLRWGWSWLTAIELVAQYTWRVTLPLLFGRVVICDRYIYDALADWAGYFDEKRSELRLAARVLRLLTPRPQIGYWMDIPVEVVRSRSKDGLPEAFLLAQSASYKRMAELFGLHRVDARRGREEISDRIVCQVLSAYFDDYHTLMNSLFLKNPGQWM
jgi:thymidylate kinase